MQVKRNDGRCGDAMSDVSGRRYSSVVGGRVDSGEKCVAEENLEIRALEQRTIDNETSVEIPVSS